MKDLISIITPSYNSVEFIEETLVSVINQTYTHWELIIVDDCSKDKSVDLIDKYTKKDERIKLIKLEKNSGTANARNVGIKNSKGKYIAFLDSDDLWLENKLETQLRFMKAKGVHLTYTAFGKISNNGSDINKYVNVPKKIDYKLAKKSNFMQTLTVMYNRDYFGDVVMPNIRYEDYATWLSLIKKSGNAYGIQKILAMYRIVDESYSSKKIQTLRWTYNIYKSSLGYNKFKSFMMLIVFIVFTSIKYLGLTEMIYGKLNKDYLYKTRKELLK